MNLIIRLARRTGKKSDRSQQKWGWNSGGRQTRTLFLNNVIGALASR